MRDYVNDIGLSTVAAYIGLPRQFSKEVGQSSFMSLYRLRLLLKKNS